MKKINKDKLEIVKLRNIISNLETDKEWYKNKLEKVTEERDDLKSYRDQHEGSVDIRISHLAEQNKSLLEIIRWQINPNTTKHPFRPEIGQIDEKERSFGNRFY